MVAVVVLAGLPTMVQVEAEVALEVSD
jgi:hypothetical protein